MLYTGINAGLLILIDRGNLRKDGDSRTAGTHSAGELSTMTPQPVVYASLSLCI
jgi:hypothetical protein